MLLRMAVWAAMTVAAKAAVWPAVRAAETELAMAAARGVAAPAVWNCGCVANAVWGVRRKHRRLGVK
jgi:hypothetical protein